MDPISAALMLGGLAFQVFGGAKSMGANAQYNKANQDSIRLQQQVEAQRKQAMELDAHRKELEIVRTQQRARSIALTNSTSQGAAQGSGLQGGYGQIAGQSGFNLEGVQQNLSIGRNIFGLNEQISNNKILMSQYSQNAQTGQGIASFGQSLFGAAQNIGKLASPWDKRAPTPYAGQQGGIWGDLGPMDINA